jgi:D-alanine-D-alanine ligase
MNKQLSKNAFRQAGLKAPLGELLVKQDDQPETVARQAKDIFQKISPPWVVKPADRGSSVGLFLARDFKELVRAIGESYRYSDKVLVEEYLKGREATVGVIDDFRGKDVYALPPIEIRRPGGKDIWTYDDKYNGATEEICPGAFSAEEKRELERQAVAAHKALGLRHYSRSDFILTSRGIYILETNSLPGMTSESLLPKALKAVGCEYSDFLQHLIQLALKK